MKLSDWLPSVFVEGDGDDIQVATKKFSQFPEATGEGIQGVGLKDGNNVRFELTTDSIKVNPEPFRNSKGQFIGTPEELAGLENQRDVNNFLYEAINDIDIGDIDLDGYAKEEWVTEQIGAIEFPEGVDLDGYATEDYVDVSVENLAASIPSLDGYATETYVDDSIAAEIAAREAGDQALQAQIDGIGFPPGTIVSDEAPDAEEGMTWYDTVRLELFVYAMGAWLPCSPLGARVEQGEVLQAQILSRVEAGEVQQQTLVDTKLSKAEVNEVANSFRIKGAGGTYISASGGELGLYHVKYPEAETHAATMGYVDDEIAKVSVSAYPTATRPFNIKTDRTFINLRAGELILTNQQGAAVSVISEANALAFHAVDADGNRVVPDVNAIEYACRLAAAIQLFNHDITSQILRISQTGQSGGYVDFSYMKDVDTFCLGWVSPGILTKTSEMDRLVDDQRVHVRVPDLIV